MMDIFIIPRNKKFTLQQCRSPFIFKSIIKFIKIPKEAVQITDYTTKLFHSQICSIYELPTPQAMLLSFSQANQPKKIYCYPTRGYPTTRLLSSLPYPTRPEVEKSLPVRAWPRHPVIPDICYTRHRRFWGITYLLTGVRCRPTSVAKKHYFPRIMQSRSRASKRANVHRHLSSHSSHQYCRHKLPMFEILDYQEIIQGHITPSLVLTKPLKYQIR